MIHLINAIHSSPPVRARFWYSATTTTCRSTWIGWRAKVARRDCSFLPRFSPVSGARGEERRGARTHGSRAHTWKVRHRQTHTQRERRARTHREGLWFGVRGGTYPEHEFAIKTSTHTSIQTFPGTRGHVLTQHPPRTEGDAPASSSINCHSLYDCAGSIFCTFFFVCLFALALFFVFVFFEGWIECVSERRFPQWLGLASERSLTPHHGVRCAHWQKTQRRRKSAEIFPRDADHRVLALAFPPGGYRGGSR